MSFRVRLAIRAAKILLKRGETLEYVFGLYSGLTNEEKQKVREAVGNA